MPTRGRGHWTPPYSRSKNSYDLALYLTLGSKVGQMLIYDGPVDIYTLGLALINGNMSKICIPEEGDIGLHLILGQRAPTTLLYT